jgi:hypothetical protein
MKISRRVRIVIALLTTAIVVSSVAAAMWTLWYRNPTLLVINARYSAELIDPINMATHIGYASGGAYNINSWTRQPDANHYQILIAVYEMNQITAGQLNVSVAGIPEYSSINVSSVEAITVKNVADYPSGYHMEVLSDVVIATNVPLGTPINFTTSVLYDTGILPSGNCQLQTEKCAILVTLSEYQIGLTNDNNATLTTTIALGE